MKNQTRSLYVECLRDFLKSQDIALIAQEKDRPIGTFKGKPSMVDYLPSKICGRYCSFTRLHIVTLNFEDKSKSILTLIEPWIEDKIKDIAGFIVDRNAYQTMLEALKTVRKKTPEERIRRNANGEIEFIEWDKYTYVAYLGHELGKELFEVEKYIRSNYRLEEV